MANVRDEHGNPIQLTDERGNPVQLTDEFGNPMHLTGVATTCGDPLPQTQLLQEGHDTSPRRSSSSSSSSSEDDGEGGRRRKKKGLTQKIKEKLTGSVKHKEAEHHQGTTMTSTVEVEHEEHGKKGVMEKIREKLPGHH